MRDTAETNQASLEPPLHAYSTPRRLVGEALGTALLLAIVIGSGIMGERLFVAGGIVGSLAGTAIAKRLAGTAGLLTTVFAALIFVVAAYMLWKSAGAFIRI